MLLHYFYYFTWIHSEDAIFFARDLHLKPHVCNKFNNSKVVFVSKNTFQTTVGANVAISSDKLCGCWVGMRRKRLSASVCNHCHKSFYHNLAIALLY